MSVIHKVKKYTRKTVTTIKNEGFLEFGIKSLQKLKKVQVQKTTNQSVKRQFVSLVDRQNVMAADWSNAKKPAQTRAVKAPYTINWVMSPPSGGGGHQNIFRFIEILDKQGHKNNVYIYSNYDDMTIAQARENVKAYCKAKNLTFKRFKGSMVKADALFATGWETAYVVFNEKTIARKFYFVQDFEPLFYPMGTDYVLAENTYKFGFHGITAGGWLDDKLSREYGMTCDHYDFGADPKNYRLTNTKTRKQIFFYARPVTERRGFDLGIMALELFHNKHPEYEIVLAGWDVSEWHVPFPYTNLKAMQISELSDVYNQSAAALVLSLTNMSLLPLELLATGTIPVVNEGPNNRLVSDNPYIKYTEASPQALADALGEVVSMKNLPAYAKKASESVASDGWDVAGKKFLSVLDRELGNGK
jgi:glycosyltransferase involved in cell wall biosynthesis